MNAFRRFARAIVRAVWADDALIRAVADDDVPLARRALAAGGRPDEPYFPVPPPDCSRALFECYIHDPKRGQTPREIAQRRAHPGMLALLQGQPC